MRYRSTVNAKDFKKSFAFRIFKNHSSVKNKKNSMFVIVAGSKNIGSQSPALPIVKLLKATSRAGKMVALLDKRN